MSDSPDLTTEELAARIKQRLAELALSPRAASLKTKRGADVIRNLLRAAESGKRYHPRLDTIQAIAKVLEVDPVWLQIRDGRGDADNASPRAPRLLYSSETPDFSGILETGVYRRIWIVSGQVVVDDYEIHDTIPPIGVDPRYPHIRQLVYKCRGDGGAKVGIIHGMYVTAVDIDGYLSEIGPMTDGMVVIVGQMKDDYKYLEISLREYRSYADRIELLSLSSSREFEPIPLPLDWEPSVRADLTVHAVVTGAHLPFKNEGFIPHTD